MNYYFDLSIVYWIISSKMKIGIGWQLHILSTIMMDANSSDVRITHDMGILLITKYPDTLKFDELAKFLVARNSLLPPLG